jgi:hypothetical protein
MTDASRTPRRYGMPASWQRNLKHYPITKELQESIQAFRAIDAEIELQPILDYLASRELREAIRKNASSD